MNATLLAPRATQPDSLPVESTTSLRLLPAPKPTQTQEGGGNSAGAYRPLPFWTWFIANPRQPHSV